MIAMAGAAKKNHKDVGYCCKRLHIETAVKDQHGGETTWSEAIVRKVLPSKHRSVCI
jgi:hypothetical protein